MVRLLRKGYGRACSRLVIFFFIFTFLFLPVDPLLADDCEIVKTFFYDRKQGEIVTDWLGGVAYKRYQSVVYHCADLRIRDNSPLMSEKEIELTVTFDNGSTVVKEKLWCDRKGGDNGDIYSCTACFESDSPVSGLTCTFK